MKYCITVNVTPSAAAKLLLTREMDLSNFISNIQLRKMWDYLLDLSIDEILHIIDCNKVYPIAEVKDIPQFGKIETLNKVPFYFQVRGSTEADYAQLGFYLKEDLNSSVVANTKYGENHGKGASLLGIVNCVNAKIVPSIITDSFCSLSLEEQNKALIILLFRIPIIQILLQKAKDSKVLIYDPMSLLSPSTQKRRAQCIKAILKILKKLDSTELNNRINNIIVD